MTGKKGFNVRCLNKRFIFKIMCIKYDALTMNGFELHHDQARLKGDLSEFLITCQRYNRKKMDVNIEWAYFALVFIFFKVSQKTYIWS